MRGSSASSASSDPSTYIWRFVDPTGRGRPRLNRFRSQTVVPARTAESDAMSKDLKRCGFTFIGSTICYAFMQAIGMVNDHTASCFRRRQMRCGDRDVGRRLRAQKKGTGLDSRGPFRGDS